MIDLDEPYDVESSMEEVFYPDAGEVFVPFTPLDVLPLHTHDSGFAPDANEWACQTTRVYGEGIKYRLALHRLCKLRDRRNRNQGRQTLYCF